MADQIEKNDSQKSQEPIDLSALAGLTFGPSWSDPKSSVKRQPSERFERNEERRQQHPRVQQSRSSSPQRDRRPQFSRHERSVPEVFHPTVNVAFYPEDEPFLALIKAIRVSCKTYELFELASLILEKPERLVAVISPRPSRDNIQSKLFVCLADHMPFESEDEALRYALKHHISTFFDVEEIEVEPPKGSFPVINRCGFTSELLGPPNYHRYQDLLKEHYSNNLSSMPYERFLSKIESVKDEEVAKAWAEKMSKGKRYTLKKVPEGQEPVVFNTWEDVRSYLLTKHKKELVQEANSVRFHGSMLEKMPKGDIRRSIELALRLQREFPLDTANNIRGRLRRMNLSIYKKGSKGITYVCAVRRKFRQEGISFAENLQSLVDFIEKHPNCLSSKLPELYLGIQQPSAAPSSESAEAPQETTAITPEQQSQIRKLMLDLRWLVSEGYVTEYGNSTLYAPAPISSSKPSDEKHAETHEETTETHEEHSTEESLVSTEEVITEAKETKPKKETKALKKAPAKKKTIKKSEAKEEIPSVEEQTTASAE